MRLNHRDLECLSGAILALRAHDAGAAPAVLVAAVTAAVPCDYFRVLECARRDAYGSPDAFRIWESDPRITGEMQRGFARFASVHPFVRASRPTGNLDAAIMSDFYSARQFRGTEIGREMYRPIDVGPVMGAGAGTGARLTMITVARHVGGRDFSDRDRLVLSLLRPHIAAAARPGAPLPCGPVSGLTPREAEVAGWMARGKTNAEIAAILGLSPRTAEKHVERVLRKAGAHSRTVASLAFVARRAEYASPASRS